MRNGESSRRWCLQLPLKYRRRIVMEAVAVSVVPVEIVGVLFGVVDVRTCA